MAKIFTLIFLVSMSSYAIAQVIQPTSYTFMKVHVKNEKGETENSRFFIGKLPKINQSVEMIYVGNNQDGSMNFQLKVKE